MAPQPLEATTVVVDAPGDASSLTLRQLPVADPGPGEVLVRQAACGVNFIDVYHRSGVYPLATLPHGIGVEAAGEIEAVGEGVADFRVGDRVAYVHRIPGAYASRRTVPADVLVRVPDAVPLVDAAAVLLKGMTVEYLVGRTFTVRPGMTVLWHAAAGGVGLLACSWLRDLGATVIGTVSSDEKAAEARTAGCDHVVVYTREDFVERVHALTGGSGVPVVYDAVGRTTFSDSLRCLAPRGMLVAFGNASGTPGPFDPLDLSRGGSLYLTRPTLFDYIADPDELAASAAAVFDRVTRGVLAAAPSQQFALADAAAAHRALEARATTGSTVLIP